MLASAAGNVYIFHYNHINNYSRYYLERVAQQSICVSCILSKTILPPRPPAIITNTDPFPDNDNNYSDGELRHVRAHPGGPAVRHRLPGDPGADARLPLEAGERHPHRAPPGHRTPAQPLHGPQATRHPRHVLVQARVDRLHAALPDDRADVAAGAGPPLQGQGPIQPARQLARDRDAHGRHVSFFAVVGGWGGQGVMSSAPGVCVCVVGHVCHQPD